jgi:hypothetical protein
MVIGAKTGLDACQMRSGTESPCARPAAVRVRGIPFCERCARELDSYAAIGDLAQAQVMISGWTREARRLRNDPLVEALEQIQKEFAGRFAEAGRRLRVAEYESRSAEGTLQEATR